MTIKNRMVVNHHHGGDKIAIEAKKHVCRGGIVTQFTSPPVTPEDIQSIHADLERLESRIDLIVAGLQSIMSMLVVVAGPEHTAAVAREIDAFERARRDE